MDARRFLLSGLIVSSVVHYSAEAANRPLVKPFRGGSFCRWVLSSFSSLGERAVQLSHLPIPLDNFLLDWSKMKDEPTTPADITFFSDSEIDGGVFLDSYSDEKEIRKVKSVYREGYRFTFFSQGDVLQLILPNLKAWRRLIVQHSNDDLPRFSIRLSNKTLSLFPTRNAALHSLERRIKEIAQESRIKVPGAHPQFGVYVRSFSERPTEGDFIGLDLWGQVFTDPHYFSDPQTAPGIARQIFYTMSEIWAELKSH